VLFRGYGGVEVANVSTNVPAVADSLSEIIRNGAVLGPGDRNAAVGEMQRRLTAIGFRVAETGEYDAATTAAVQSFQRTYRIRPEGSFGPLSLARLEAAERVTEAGREGAGTTYRDGRPGREVRLVYIDGKPLPIETANAIRPMVVLAALEHRPVYLHVVSGFRTNDEQADLYAEYRRGGNLAARPGYSQHQLGLAIDFNTSDPGVYTWLKKNARKFGFVRTVPGEPWHWEYRAELVRR
jgi:peptidoglycan hydrolase-like protein with peptidoglycan-binding domain